VVNNLQVDPAVAREIAAAYLDAGDRPSPGAVAAFAQLVEESDELFRRLTQPDRQGSVRVNFTTCRAPYQDAKELITAVAESRTLEITTVAVDRDRHHPLMGNEFGGAYDRFRAVHDAFGHARTRLGFSRDEEFTVWLAQERFHTPLARWALATELHGQHSVRWITGRFAAPKAVLLEPELVRRTRSGVSRSDQQGDPS
jgi:hypothetical protein